MLPLHSEHGTLLVQDEEQFRCATPAFSEQARITLIRCVCRARFVYSTTTPLPPDVWPSFG
jgi:hypothetical protein